MVMVWNRRKIHASIQPITVHKMIAQSIRMLVLNCMVTARHNHGTDRTVTAQHKPYRNYFPLTPNNSN